MFVKKLFFRLLLVVALLAPSIVYALPSTGVVNSEEATELLLTQKGLSFLDVRTPEEFAEGHAANAVNIPLDELANRLNEVPSGPLLIVCRSGMRASNAYATLIKSGRNSDNLWFLKGYTEYSSGAPRFH